MLFYSEPFTGFFLLFFHFSAQLWFSGSHNRCTSFFTYSRYFAGVMPTTLENRVTK